MLQIQGPRALTRLNFLLTIRVRPFVLLPIRLARHGRLVPKGMLDNPNRFRNKTTSHLRLRFSIEGGYPEIEYD